jgi:branched-chain amino acid transport system ATP-binding protein
MSDGTATAAEPVLRIENLRRSFGALAVTDGVSLDIMPGELHALIGPNGAGKTTLVNQISGFVEPQAGRIIFNGCDITALPVHARAALGLARSFQVTSILPRFSALENVALAVQARVRPTRRRFGRASAEEALNGPAHAALHEVGLAARAGIAAGVLSHGERRALEIAIALAMAPKLMLLDEPMASTGHEEAARLVAVIDRLKGRFPILLVEHDMTAVFALADRITVMIYGRVLASGVPAAVRRDPAVVAAYLGEDLE